MAITHTFLDILPSTFLGAPNEENAISALPAHRLYYKEKQESNKASNNRKLFWITNLSIISSVNILYCNIKLSNNKKLHNSTTNFHKHLYNLDIKNKLSAAILFTITGY